MLSNFAAVDNYNFSGGNITSDSGALLFARFIDSLSLRDAFRSLPFDDARKNPVHSYSDILLGQIITSDSGALLFARFIDSLSLRDAFRSLPFDDARKNPVHSYSDILLGQIFKFMLGYFRQADQSVLRLDPFLLSAAPSQPTVSRFFSCASASLNAALHQLLHINALSYLNRQEHDLIFDADSTLIETTGRQEASAYIPHYSSVGYHPLVINEYHSKLLVASLLRCGNSYSANGIIEQLRSVFSGLQLSSSRTIFFRGDSAFYDSKLMNYLEQQPFRVRYMIRCRHFGKLIKECMDDMEAKGIDFQQYTKHEPYIGELFYSLQNDEPRRVVYKAYRSIDQDGQISLFPEIYAVMTNCLEWSACHILRFYEQRGNSENFTKAYRSIDQDGQISLFPEIYAVMTNCLEWSACHILRFYEQRGNSENFTKELKDDFGAGTLSHPKFLSNELEFLLKAWAYNIYHLFLNQKAKYMPGIARMRMNTFRKEFVRIGGKVICHARQITLCISSAYARKKEFAGLMRNIQNE